MSEEVERTHPITVGELTEMLSAYPQDATVLIQAYVPACGADYWSVDSVHGKPNYPTKEAQEQKKPDAFYVCVDGAEYAGNYANLPGKEASANKLRVLGGIIDKVNEISVRRADDRNFDEIADLRLGLYQLVMLIKEGDDYYERAEGE